MSEFCLPEDEVIVLCRWAVQTVAASMSIDEDEAEALLGAASEQHRIRILGNEYAVGVECDGRWILVEDRGRLTAATEEWQTLRAMEEQFRD